MKRLSVDVYRHNYNTFGGRYYDPTNGGVTSQRDTFTLFWDCTKEEAIKYCEENSRDLNSCLYLVNRELWGEDHSYAEPLFKPKNCCGPMFGGNFVWTCDSRLYKMDGKLCACPIPVHDRFETEELNRILSI